jgi:hypothetical protein
MEWARRVATEKHLTAGARDVLVNGLAFHAGRTSGDSWAGVETLADELHLDPRTVRRALREIETAGILEVERRPGHTTLWVFPAVARWTPRASAGVPLSLKGRGTPLTRGEGYPSHSVQRPLSSSFPNPSHPMRGEQGTNKVEQGAALAPERGGGDEPSRVDVHRTVAELKARIRR